MASAKKALVLNGMAEGEDGLSEILAGELKELGYEVTGLILRDKEIAPCLGCFGCWIKTPGICVVDDDGREVVWMTVQSDLMVFLTPVTFGGYSSDPKRAPSPVCLQGVFMPLGGLSWVSGR